MAFDQPFWLRIAARADTASGADKARLSSLASTVMLLVEKMVQATEEQLTDSGSILQEILKAGADDNGKWVKPLPETQIEGMRQVRVAPCIARPLFCGSRPSLERTSLTTHMLGRLGPCSQCCPSCSI